jgi:hypothetical protein
MIVARRGADHEHEEYGPRTVVFRATELKETERIDCLERRR